MNTFTTVAFLAATLSYGNIAAAYPNNNDYNRYMQEQTYYNTLRIQQEQERQRREMEQERRNYEMERKQQELMDSFPDRYNTDVDRW